MYPQLAQVSTCSDWQSPHCHTLYKILGHSWKLQKGISACWADTSTDFNFPFPIALLFSSEALVSTYRFCKQVTATVSRMCSFSALGIAFKLSFCFRCLLQYKRADIPLFPFSALQHCAVWSTGASYSFVRCKKLGLFVNFLKYIGCRSLSPRQRKSWQKMSYIFDGKSK